MLTIAHDCSRLLTIAHDCSRLPTIAHDFCVCMDCLHLPPFFDPVPAHEHVSSSANRWQDLNYIAIYWQVRINLTTSGSLTKAPLWSVESTLLLQPGPWGIPWHPPVVHGSNRKVPLKPGRKWEWLEKLTRGYPPKKWLWQIVFKNSVEFCWFDNPKSAKRNPPRGVGGGSFLTLFPFWVDLGGFLCKWQTNRKIAVEGSKRFLNTP